MSIILAQLKSARANFSANLQKLEELCQAYGGPSTSNIIVLPELFLCGYLIRDYIFDIDFAQQMQKAISKVCELSLQYNVEILVGAIDYPDDLLAMRSQYLSADINDLKIYNSLIYIKNGLVERTFAKHSLPNVHVFNERRYFASASLTEGLIIHQGKRIGILNCEDIWSGDYLSYIVQQNPECLIVCNASPYYYGKCERRYQHVQNIAKKHGISILYLNSVGGQDHLIFDGHSFIVDEKGNLTQKMEGFAETVYEHNLEQSLHHNHNYNTLQSQARPKAEELYSAIMLATCDYVTSIGIQQVFIALSGGIDSALVAMIAADCFGPEAINLAFMPTKYTSAASRDDALYIASKLGVVDSRYQEYDIDVLCDEYHKLFAHVFHNLKSDITEENLQARIRGNIIMALANKFKGIVLNTSNKSEAAVGYTTLYGDAVGGYAPISDLYKTEVYELAAWRNLHVPKHSKCLQTHILSENILTKEPSAELRFDHKDSDSLPPYPILDDILYSYIEQKKSFSEICHKHPQDLVFKVINMVMKAEFKRQQAPLGAKVSKMQFNTDRRFPVEISNVLDKSSS